MSVRIHVLDEANAAAWDAFVRERPEGSFFHLSAWARVIARHFGHATHYVLAEQDGAVVGVLPLGRMKTLLFGDLLASTPYCVYGGALAATPEAGAATSPCRASGDNKILGGVPAHDAQRGRRGRSR